LPNQVAIIGSGGIMTAEDFRRMLDAGAALVQLYTGFIYGGPSTVKRFLRTLQERGTPPTYGESSVAHPI
jgi:dihydroorotate dehydrogenase